MIEKKPKTKIAKHKSSDRSDGKFLATVHMLSTQEGGRSKAFRDDFRPQLYLTDPDISTSCFIHLIDGRQEVSPGETATVEASLLIPAILGNPLQPKTKFWLREGARTIGWGVVKRLV